MRSARVALTAGLALLVAVAVGVIASEGPPIVLATNGVQPGGHLQINGKTGAFACQSEEQVPAGTRAVRLSLEAFMGLKVAVTILSGGQIVSSGQRGANWGEYDVSVPIRPVASTISPATVCFRVERGNERVNVLLRGAGPATAARSGSESLGGRLRFEYVGGDGPSWLSRVLSVARHMGLGRAWPGTWVALLVLTLMLAATALACGLVLRGPNE